MQRLQTPAASAWWPCSKGSMVLINALPSGRVKRPPIVLPRPMPSSTITSRKTVCRIQVSTDTPSLSPLSATLDPTSSTPESSEPQPPVYRVVDLDTTSTQDEKPQNVVQSNGTRPQVAATTTVSINQPFLPKSKKASKELPYMLYIPDLDGQGLTSKRQWQSLSSAFDLHVVTIASDDRSTLKQLVNLMKAHLERDLPDLSPERPVYLLADGFGAVLAIHLALECSEVISRLVLVNPATCYKGSPLALVGPLLARLPPALYQAAPYALAPILGNPFRMTASTGGGLLGLADPNAVAQVLQEVLAELQQLSESLPQATAQWRLDLLNEHASTSMDKLRDVCARVMVVLGGADRVLPNEDHVKLLQGAMTRGFVKVLPDSGHALLAEPGVDLVQVMREEGFYITRRTFTSEVQPGQALNKYGYAGPLEVPTPQEVQRVASEWTGNIRQLSSPVFFSTLPDGRIVQGLEGVPEDRPLLIVGNHQVYAFDMYILVEQLALERGMLVRGLAHPGVFQDANGDRDSRILPDVLSNTYQTFGAVPVTPQNFYRLLQRKERVLLYPGGVREGFKRKNEQYQLFWPSRSEFVRMAAKCGATILPLASIGVDDGLEILLDTDEIAASPWLGPSAREAAAAMPVPRVGVSEDKDLDQTFIPPIIAPRVPQRFYFRFQRPIRLDPSMADDKSACDAVYADVKGEVEGGIRWLLLQREKDPYRDFLPRYLYENSPGGTHRQAPTFRLPV